MLEIGKPRESLAQRELECGHGGQFVAEAQNLHRRRAIEGNSAAVAASEAILEVAVHAAGFAFYDRHSQHLHTAMPKTCPPRRSHYGKPTRLVSRGARAISVNAARDGPIYTEYFQLQNW